MSGVPFVIADINVPLFLLMTQTPPDDHKARNEADDKEKALSERKNIDFLKLGLALHHQILPLIDGQEEDFGSTITEFGDKEANTVVLGTDGKQILHRFHSDLTRTGNNIDARTILLEPTLQNPLAFSSRIFPTLNTPLIQSAVAPDEGHTSYISTTTNTIADHIHTEITDGAGEKTNTFDSQLMRRNLPAEIDMVESHFRASSRDALRTLSCTVGETSDTNLEVKCHPLR
jgi:hypothetical protein